MPRSAEFLEFAQAAGGFGVFDLDLVTGGISGTPLFFDLIGLGFRDGTLNREEWVATIHPEDLEAVVVELGAAIDSGIPYQSEYRTLTLTGEVRWLAGRAQIVNGPDGHPARLIGTLSDITARKHPQENMSNATTSLKTSDTTADIDNLVLIDEWNNQNKRGEYI